MWKLTIEDDEGKQTALPLAHEEYGLGRGESNAIRLTDRNISRSHAVLHKNGQGWYLKDLQSYNGTFVNGVRVVGEQLVNSGDLVQIGDYRLELLDESVAQPSTPTTTPSHTSPVHQRPNRLVVVVGPSPGDEFPLDKDYFTIGRSEEATISINHSSVSRLHAELIALGNGRYEIVDKGSANGIRINGVELKRGILEAGDALELGDVRLRFVGAGKIFRADQSQQLAAVTGFDSIGPASIHPGAPGRSGASVGKLVGIGVAVGIAVIALVLALVRPGSPSNGDSSSHKVQLSDDAVQKILKEAKEKLVASRDYDGAHKKALEIPEGSSGRDDPVFKEIEGEWADWMFKKVEQASENAEKKNLLKTISSTPSVDPERRKRAASLLQEIEAKEPPPPPPVTWGDPGQHTSVSAPSASASVKVVDPNSVPGAPPVGLAAEDAQRKILEPKVFGGKATVDEIRLLKAICSHLGNRDCRDRAAAILKKKLAEQ